MKDVDSRTYMSELLAQLDRWPSLTPIKAYEELARVNQVNIFQSLLNGNGDTDDSRTAQLRKLFEGESQAFMATLAMTPEIIFDRFQSRIVAIMGGVCYVEANTTWRVIKHLRHADQRLIRGTAKGDSSGEIAPFYKDVHPLVLNKKALAQYVAGETDSSPIIADGFYRYEHYLSKHSTDSTSVKLVFELV